MSYRHGTHTVFQIHLHIVWTTKYRKKVLRGEVGKRVRELVRQICRENDIEIIKGHVSSDHVHLFVSIPPQTDEIIKAYIENQQNEEGQDFKVEDE